MIRVKFGSTNVPIEFIHFPGGEEHVRLSTNVPCVNPVVVTAKLTDSAEIMKMILVVDAVRRLFLSNGTVATVNLVVPYLPYARQDRVAVPGETLAAAVMAGIINQLNCSMVTVFDPHSDVSAALVNNLRVVTQAGCVSQSSELVGLIKDQDSILIAPDAGASKKIYKLASEFDTNRVTVLDKDRDPINGVITGIKYSYGISDLTGKTAIIADDICDGGRTFIEAAKVLRSLGASKVILYVTHGLFTKGVEPLYPLIDTIYTTDSYCTTQYESVNYIKVIKEFE